MAKLTCVGCGFKYLALKDYNDFNSWEWNCRQNQPEIEKLAGCGKKTEVCGKDE